MRITITGPAERRFGRNHTARPRPGETPRETAIRALTWRARRIYGPRAYVSTTTLRTESGVEVEIMVGPSARQRRFDTASSIAARGMLYWEVRS
jgi:hypothetical protein